MRWQNWLYALPLRLRSLFRREQVERDLNDELQYHLEHKAAEFAAGGMTADESRAAAVRAMDGLDRCKEACRDTRRVNVFEHAVQDVRYGLRVLAKSPGFTAVSVLTLALAIGANAVVFGIMNALILRPLNVPQADSFYSIERTDDHYGKESYLDYLDLRDRNRSFEGLAGYSVAQAGIDSGENPTSAWLDEVSGNYFDVMKLQPYLGSYFHAADEHGPNSAPYIVLSYGFWHTHFHDDRGIVGRNIQVNKHPFKVLGVTPPEYRGTLLPMSPAAYVPMVNQEQVEGASVYTDALHSRKALWVFATIGHLKAGVTTAQAAADLNSIGSYLEKTYPADDGPVSYRLVRPGLYGTYLGNPVRGFVGGLMLLSGLILLAACANLGSLFAARASDRSREVALRLALGSSRNRILRQLFTEAMLISVAGGALGLWFSVELLRGLSMWQPLPRFPINIPVAPDASVYLMALALAVLAGMLFGLVPVRQVLRANPYQVVKAGPSGTAGRRITIRDLSLVAQIAICAVMVTSSMVALRGLVRSFESRYGFEPKGAMLLQAELNMGGYGQDAVAVMQRRMIDMTGAIAGVESVASIDTTPLGEAVKAPTIFREETTDLRPGNAVGRAMLFSVSPGYFHAAGTALFAGRDVTWHDDHNAPRVAVVNPELARKLFGSVSGALGRRFKLRDGARVEVVGVTEEGKYGSLTEDPTMAMFLPLLQSPASETWLVVRSKRDPKELAANLRAAMHALDPGLPVYIQTWDKQLDNAMFVARVATVALGVLGAIGAILSLTGIFGMAAYSVSRRLRELGIRMALGAKRHEVLGAALGRAFKLLALGSFAGMALGILSGRVLAAIVFQATPRDPLVLAAVAVTMLLLGLLATWAPAQRALGLDPVTLLREE
jgi:predicted permease